VKEKMYIKNLQKSREHLKFSQKELAKILGVNNSTLSGWETGKDTMPLKQLIKYANLFNFSIDYLFGINENKNKIYYPLKIELYVIGNNLKQIRKQNNFTLYNIAQKLNTSISTYWAYENGNILIPACFLFGLTKIYPNISLDKILGRKEKIQNKKFQRNNNKKTKMK